MNLDLLEQLTREFLVIYEKSPARLKTKLNSCKGLVLNKVSVRSIFVVVVFVMLFHHIFFLN